MNHNMTYMKLSRSLDRKTVFCLCQLILIFVQTQPRHVRLEPIIYELSKFKNVLILSLHSAVISTPQPLHDPPPP